MRLARDLILVICAVISTLCLVYIVFHLDTTPVETTKRLQREMILA
jgi:hypothetical protein